MVASLINQLRSFSERNDQHGGVTVTTIRVPARNVKASRVVLGANDLHNALWRNLEKVYAAVITKEEKS